MNQQFHKKENVVDVYRQTSWSGQIMGHIKKIYWSHVQYKYKEKVIQNVL